MDANVLESITLAEISDWLISKGRLSDFLALVIGSNGLFNCSTQATMPEHPSGNIYRRQILLDKTGSTFEGHTHNYDHVTYLIRGKVLRKVRETPNGDPVEHIFEAPSAMHIRANCYHEFTALTDDVIAECIYAFRDKDGMVTQSWDRDARSIT